MFLLKNTVRNKLCFITLHCNFRYVWICIGFLQIILPSIIPPSFFSMNSNYPQLYLSLNLYLLNLTKLYVQPTKNNRYFHTCINKIHAFLLLSFFDHTRHAKNEQTVMWTWEWLHFFTDFSLNSIFDNTLFLTKYKSVQTFAYYSMCVGQNLPGKKRVIALCIYLEPR